MGEVHGEVIGQRPRLEEGHLDSVLAAHFEVVLAVWPLVQVMS